jgi:fucose permease
MDFWLVVGIFLLGCGLGSLVTAAFYLTQLRKVKAHLHTTYSASSGNSQTFSDAAKTESEKRSA